MIDFKLCIICQSYNFGQTVDLTNEEFKECVTARCEFGDEEFLKIQNRIIKISFAQNIFLLFSTIIIMKNL